MSSMLLTSRPSPWLFSRAIVSRRIARAGKVPPASLTRRPSAPAIEIGDHAEDQESLIRRNRIEAHLGGKLGAVLPPPGEVTGQTNRGVSRELAAVPGMLGAQPCGDEEIDRLADQLIVGEAKHPLRLAVGERDLSNLLDHHDAEGADLDHTPQYRLRHQIRCGRLSAPLVTRSSPDAAAGPGA
jgi:hypothetical protein